MAAAAGDRVVLFGLSLNDFIAPGDRMRLLLWRQI